MVESVKSHEVCDSRMISLWSLRWRHNGHNSVSDHQPYDCLLNLLFRRRSKKTSKLRATGLCAGNSPGTGEFPAQSASNAENVSIWWRQHDISRAIRVWGTPIWELFSCKFENSASFITGWNLFSLLTNRTKINWEQCLHCHLFCCLSSLCNIWGYSSTANPTNFVIDTWQNIYAIHLIAFK